MKKFRLAVMLLMSFSSVAAQSLWTTAGVQFDPMKKLSAKIEGEYRTADKFAGTDRWTVGLGLEYKVIPYLRVDAGYKFIYKYVGERVTSKGNIVESYRQPRQRAWVSVSGVYKWKRFSFSLRERMQYTHQKSMYAGKTNGNGKPKDDEYIEGKDKFFLRSRLKIDYNIKKSAFKPFISVELYNDLDGFSYSKTRFTAGTEFRINRHNAVEAFYRYIDYSGHDEEGGHIIGIGYQFKF